MPSCIFRGCTNYTRNGKVLHKNLSYHALPQDELLKEKWVHIIRVQRREDDWLPSPYTKVCSEHFSESDIYVTKKNYQRIKKTAVPIIVKKEEQYIVSSPTNLEDVQLSEEDSIFETPITAILKKMITKLASEKRMLQSKNNNLTRKSKRLKAKCIYLRQLVSKLRKNILLLTRSVESINSSKDQDQEAIVENVLQPSGNLQSPCTIIP